ncbi:sugar ABC transporter permease [Demequina sp. TTPB684]|uniref:carbohydrate ABC transporter permease n=1 Tax=unclassified Demequina TaxID=2620311 RepID=UPI001CF25084|nr:MULTISPECIES: sugar ABC transporter permease [unclassified Demequina]MCB2411915.1 sugar ABC transporter permease [Demequina sp. TTPB684]UPU87639.1 sugar ABC transporter permease [Demequina sp. TMPB413]
MPSMTRTPKRQVQPQDAPRIPQRGGGKLGYWLYFIPGAILVGVVIFYPIIRNLRLSFFHWRGGRAEEQFAGFENWTALFQDSEYLQSFMNIALVIVAMVIVPTLLGLVVAAALFDVVGRRFGGKLSSFLRATYYLPQILPIAVAGVMFSWILKPNSDGVLNQFLSFLTGDDVAVNWLGGQYSTAIISTMVLMIWIQIGYPVVIFMAALQRVEPELYEASELDGANWFQRFRAITLPMIRPEVFVVGLTTTIAALKVFAPVFILTRGGPSKSTYVPSFYAYQEFISGTDKGYAAAIASSITIVVFIVSVIFIKAQTRAERKDA